MRISSSVIGIAMIVGALPIWPVTAAAVTTFVIEAADSSGTANVGYSTSIAIDAQGVPHVSYADLTNGNLKYARRSAGVWTKETADGSANFVGTNTSIELDANGNPQVSYYDGTTRDLKFAWKSGGVWNREVADASANFVGQYSSVELDAMGNPHVSYYDATTKDLKYASRSGGGWTTETVDGSTTNAGQQCALALDAFGIPHVTYLDEVDVSSFMLKHAWKSGGGWSTEIADSGYYNEIFVGFHTSSEIDAGGTLHVTYMSQGSAVGLKYARKMGGLWTREFADSSGGVGQFSSLALDAQGNPHVSYEDGGNTNVRYARKSGGVWTIQYADSVTNSGQYTALALDALGRPHITHYDATSGLGQLRYLAGSAPTGVASSAGPIHSLQVFPNPIASGEASIRFEMRPGTPIDLAVYDVSGRRVSTIVADAIGSGTGVASWTGLDAANRRLAPGVYLLRLVAGTHVESKRVTVVR
jgi:hypothetical protein